MEKYVKFKHLLEYFVSHLHWIVNGDKTHPGYEKYIKPIPITVFKTAGYGWKGGKIQQQITEWDTYDEYKVSICIYASAKQSSAGNYLVWNDTWVNVRPKWQGDEIQSLYLTREEKGDAKDELCYSLKDLGLFDEQDPNGNLKKFFDQYYSMMLEELIGTEMKTYINLLESNKNLILTGAPGTGKTYLAKQMAKQMIGTDDLENNEQYGFVQFHPSYDYTDFVEGLRPTKPDAKGNIGFELKEGVFKEFCGKALADGDKKYVFVIDEINRGDISKIFGELFFSIDPGYRGKKGAVKTQYANMHEDDVKFYVPENVYIIGTMNDIDRSVESMDFAMRRRFAWREIKAETQVSMLSQLGDMRGEAENRMTNLNNEISKTENLTSAYHIGPSYFLKLLLYKGDSDGGWKSLWNNHIEGVLREYLRGSENVDGKIGKLRAAFNNDKPVEGNGSGNAGTVDGEQ